MDAPCEVRLFRESDEAAVVALWTEVLPYTAPHNQPARSIRCKLQEQPELFLVAVVEDRVVGTVLGGYDGHRGWIYSLAVDPSQRQRGIGTALVRHLEQEFSKRGCPKINLQVLPNNAGVVEFYRKLGYVVEPRISLGKVL